jgi:type II secretory pathway component PulC
MSLPSRFAPAAVHGAWLCAGIAVSLAVPATLSRSAHLPTALGAGQLQADAATEPGHPLRMHGVDWSAFKDSSETLPVERGSLAQRFRLVGTFLVYSSRLSDGEVTRKAVLDDRTKSLQRIVVEGEAFEGITTLKVGRDRVTLRQGSHEETLSLKFESAATAGGTAGDQTVTAGLQGRPAQPVEGQDRFGGRQVGENKWVFERRPLVDYYAELRDNPDRLVKLFDSFKPVYDERRRVSGYRVKYEGEPEFLKSVGLQEGDVVRTVNSMRMTSQRRAEFFIREFIDNRSNAFVLDVERGGQPAMLTYQAK